MNRTRRLKIGYVLALVLLGLVVITLLSYFRWSSGTIVMMAGLLLVPGRIQGHYYRSLFRGRRLLDEGRPREAIEHLEAFLQELQRRPWMRGFIWLTWAFYTPNVELMARTNLGAANLKLGQVDEAEHQFRAASRLDPQAPVPWHNLAIVHRVRGETVLADEAQERARALGLSSGAIDRLAQQGAKLLAEVEGTGDRKSTRTDV